MDSRQAPRGSRSSNSAWWGAFLWALLIAILLSIPVGVVPPGSGRLLDFLPEIVAQAIRLLADKVVHAGLFAGQAWWLLRARVPAWRAVAYSGFYGALTEVYQAWLPSRTGDVWDALADVLGAVLLALWWRWRHPATEPQSTPPS